MLVRQILPRVATLLRRNPAVVLLGPRQVGKTTLAKALMRGRDALYLDLESPRPTVGFHNARADVAASRSFVVYAGAERFPLAPGVEAIGLRDMMGVLAGGL